jgi:hypothetical protein
VFLCDHSPELLCVDGPRGGTGGFSDGGWRKIFSNKISKKAKIGLPEASGLVGDGSCWKMGASDDGQFHLRSCWHLRLSPRSVGNLLTFFFLQNPKKTKIRLKIWSL